MKTFYLFSVISGLVFVVAGCDKSPSEKLAEQRRNGYRESSTTSIDVHIESGIMTPKTGILERLRKNEFVLNYVGDLKVKNNSKYAISSVEAYFEYVQPGREIPYFSHTVRIGVPSGIEPGETKELRFEHIGTEKERKLWETNKTGVWRSFLAEVSTPDSAFTTQQNKVTISPSPEERKEQEIKLAAMRETQRKNSEELESRRKAEIAEKRRKEIENNPSVTYPRDTIAGKSSDNKRHPGGSKNEIEQSKPKTEGEVQLKGSAIRFYKDENPKAEILIEVSKVNNQQINNLEFILDFQQGGNQSQELKFSEASIVPTEDKSITVFKREFANKKNVQELHALTLKTQPQVWLGSQVCAVTHKRSEFVKKLENYVTEFDAKFFLGGKTDVQAKEESEDALKWLQRVVVSEIIDIKFAVDNITELDRNKYQIVLGKCKEDFGLFDIVAPKKYADRISSTRAKKVDSKWTIIVSGRLNVGVSKNRPGKNDNTVLLVYPHEIKNFGWIAFYIDDPTTKLVMPENE